MVRSLGSEIASLPTEKELYQVRYPGLPWDLCLPRIIPRYVIECFCDLISFVHAMSCIGIGGDLCFRKKPLSSEEASVFGGGLCLLRRLLSSEEAPVFGGDPCLPLSSEEAPELDNRGTILQLCPYSYSE